MIMHSISELDVFLQLYNVCIPSVQRLKSCIVFTWFALVPLKHYRELHTYCMVISNQIKLNSEKKI